MDRHAWPLLLTALAHEAHSQRSSRTGQLNAGRVSCFDGPSRSARLTRGESRSKCRCFRMLNNLARQNRHVSSFSRATICIGLGETDLAFKWLEQAYQERLWYLALLAVEPMFDRLRGDPRFTDLVRRMNLMSAAKSSPQSLRRCIAANGAPIQVTARDDGVGQRASIGWL